MGQESPALVGDLGWGMGLDGLGGIGREGGRHGPKAGREGGRA